MAGETGRWQGQSQLEEIDETTVDSKVAFVEAKYELHLLLRLAAAMGCESCDHTILPSGELAE